MADKADTPQVKIPDRPHDWVEWSGEPGPSYQRDLTPAARAKLKPWTAKRSSTSSSSS